METRDALLKAAKTCADNAQSVASANENQINAGVANSWANAARTLAEAAEVANRLERGRTGRTGSV